MSEFPLDGVPLDEVPLAAAQGVKSGKVVYLVDPSGKHLAGIVPAEFAEFIDGMSPDELRAVLNELEDATDVRAARVSREMGDEVISWDQAKAEADL
jgi:hypothetical protein